MHDALNACDNPPARGAITAFISRKWATPTPPQMGTVPLDIGIDRVSEPNAQQDICK